MFAYGTTRWTGLPLTAAVQVVTSLEVSFPVIEYRIFHQPFWSAA